MAQLKRPGWYTSVRASAVGLAIGSIGALGYSFYNGTLNDIQFHPGYPYIEQERKAANQTEHLLWSLPLSLLFLGQLLQKKKEAHPILYIDDIEPTIHEKAFDTLVDNTHALYLLGLPPLYWIAQVANEHPHLIPSLALSAFNQYVLLSASVCGLSYIKLFRKPRLRSCVNIITDTGSPSNQFIPGSRTYYSHKVRDAIREEDYSHAAALAEHSVQLQLQESAFSMETVCRWIASSIERYQLRRKLAQGKNHDETIIMQQLFEFSECNIEGLRKAKISDTSPDLLLFQAKLFSTAGLEEESTTLYTRAVAKALQDPVLLQLGESQHPVYKIANSPYLDEEFLIKGFTLLKYSSEHGMAQAMHNEIATLDKARELVPEFIYPTHLPYKPRIMLGDQIDTWWLVSRYAKSKTVSQLMLEGDAQTHAAQLAHDVGILHSRLPVPSGSPQDSIEKLRTRWKLIDTQETLPDTIVADAFRKARGKKTQILVANTDCVPDNAGLIDGRRIWYELASTSAATSPYRDLANIVLASPIDITTAIDLILEQYHAAFSTTYTFSQARTNFLLGIIERSIELAGAWSMRGREGRRTWRKELFNRAETAYAGLPARAQYEDLEGIIHTAQSLMDREHGAGEIHSMR